MSARGKVVKTWLDDVKRFASRLHDPKDQQKFEYLFDRVEQRDPWDVESALPQGVADAIAWMKGKSAVEIMENREKVINKLE